jgi:hypothetical protein
MWVGLVVSDLRSLMAVFDASVSLFSKRYFFSGACALSVWRWQMGAQPWSRSVSAASVKPHPRPQGP